MKIVIDTNVIASAIFFGGKPRDVLNLLMNNVVDAYATEEIVEEYVDTIDYLKNKYPQKNVQIPLVDIISNLKVIKSETKVDICRDPDDNKFISCAIDADCIFIVSGDNDLLSIQSYEGVKIVTAAQFLEAF